MAKEKFAVIEMGANHPGEISLLTGITKPDVALITNAGSAHLDGFGSVKGVATAKAEIYEGLSADGIAVINKDDEYSEYWLSLCAEYKTLEFSMKARQDLKAGTAFRSCSKAFLKSQQINICPLARVIVNIQSFLICLAELRIQYKLRHTP